MAEGFFHHDPGAGGEVGMGQALHDAAEQRRRDLEVEHRSVPLFDLLAKALIGFGVVKVA